MIHGKLHPTRFSQIGFTLNSPADWRFVDLPDAQDGNKEHMHCIGAKTQLQIERGLLAHFEVDILGSLLESGAIEPLSPDYEPGV